MDETTKAIVAKITVRYPAPVVLPEGRTGTVLYDCTRLSTPDLARVAAEATGDLPEDTFDLVLGIAYRGILFAAAVAGGRDVAILEREGGVCGPDLTGRRVVVVDDVVYSGENLRRAAELVRQHGGSVVGFACIVDRSDGAVGSTSCPLWSAFQPGEE